MLIDVNTYAGHWPFRVLADNTVQAVCDNAERNGITHVVMSSLDAVFYKNPSDGNEAFMEELKGVKSTVRVIPLAVVNPNYPGWEKYARRAIEQEGFEGFEIFPQYHGYGFKPFRNPEKPYGNILPGVGVLELAKELDVPVRINMAFENYRQRNHMDVRADPTSDELYTLLSACPGAKIIVNSTVPCNLDEKMINYVKQYGNILFDISRIDGHIAYSAEATVDILGSDVLCFGSMMPFQYPEVNLLKLEFADELSDPAICAGNARGFFKEI